MFLDTVRFDTTKEKRVATKKKAGKDLVTFSDIQGLRQFVQNRVDEGMLTQKAGIQKLYDDARERYAKEIARDNLVIPVAHFTKLVKELVWSKTNHELLKDFLKSRPQSEWKAAIGEWQKIHSFIPLEWVTERSKWIRGVSSKAPNVVKVPGMGGNLEEGWLSRIPDIALPTGTFNEPIRITVKAKDPRWTVLNGANLGLIYNPDIEFNPLRRKLAEAEIHGIDVVVLTNVFGLQLVKAAGSLMVYRARMAGLNINLDILDPDYRPHAEWILRSKPDDELIFETPIERVANVFSGLFKVMTRPDKKPEFSGKIVMVLGYMDELLINTLVYDAVNYLRIRKQNLLKQEIRSLERQRDRALERGLMLEYQSAEKEIAKLAKEHTRSITTAVAAQEVNRFAPKLRSLFLKMLQEIVPNVEIIGLGSTHLQVNDKPSIAIHIPSDIRVTDSVLGNFAARKAGPKIMRKDIAQTTVICHPYSLQARDTVREADHDGKRDSVQIFAAPTLIDDEYLRKELKHTIRVVHPVQKLVWHDQFKPGSLVFRYQGDIVTQDFWPVTRPLSAASIKKRGGTSVIPYPDFGSAKYIWYMVDTDKHSGSRAKEYVWCQDQREWLGLAEGIIHSMRVSGYLGGKKFGIHMWSSNDDPTQGNHFEGHFQPDPHQMSRTDVTRHSRELFRAAEKADGKERLILLDKYQKFVLRHQDILGLDHPKLQVEEMLDRFVAPNMDFYSAVLRRAKESGLIVKPVSEHCGIQFDQRDLGIINWGTGNHFERTVDRRLTESFMYTREMRATLLQEAYWQKHPDFVKKFVRDPMYSNFFCAWGTAKVDGGYEWGFDLRDSPTRMKGWGDTVAGAIANDILRGNPSRILEGKYVITTYGDKHFFGTGITAQKLFHMCAPGVHTDRYGEHGFPPNNTGLSWIGIPVEGPQLPFLFRYLRYDQIARLAEAGFKFDWETFLPNPI